MLCFGTVFSPEDFFVVDKGTSNLWFRNGFLCLLIELWLEYSRLSVLELIGISNKFPSPLAIYYSFPLKSSRYLEPRYLKHLVFSTQILVALTEFLSLSRNFSQIHNIVAWTGPYWSIFFPEKLRLRRKVELILIFLIMNILQAENSKVIPGWKFKCYQNFNKTSVWF